MTTAEPAIAVVTVQVLTLVLAFRGVLGFTADYNAWERGWLGRKVWRWMRRIYREHPYKYKLVRRR